MEVVFEASGCERHSCITHLALSLFLFCLLTFLQEKHYISPCPILEASQTIMFSHVLYSIRECFLNGPIPASFCLFSSFLVSISKIQIEKSLDGVLWIRTHCRRMVGADKTTELWSPAKIRECSLVRLT